MYSEIHNITEDLVFSQVDQICDSIKKEESGGICTCPQCRRDAACYVLNRTPAHYIVSNRGVARAEQETLEKQQKAADIAVLVYEALKRVAHNRREATDHAKKDENAADPMTPVYNIPTIVGRLFNGINFEPFAGVKVELHREGNLSLMKDRNWQNPYNLVVNTGGTFTFWPQPIPADKEGQRNTFEYSIRVQMPGFETLNHYFKIPVLSEASAAKSYSMARTFKLPDLYMFPPGGDENIGLA
ncbi:MAG: late competence development ComFB family protein [Treponema sp.]|jgi:competence protein ComFB|nr:late competence development ComFB family protein [Treponema sp.]